MNLKSLAAPSNGLLEDEEYSLATISMLFMYKIVN